jgi:2-polyprenyl-3-methyl-5-hydroxy-6-metoxy-1,4-benzoquinol methylase
MNNTESQHLLQPLGTEPGGTALTVFRRFISLLEQELCFRKEKGQEKERLQGYYNNLFDRQGRMMPVGSHGYGQRLYPALAEMIGEERTFRILDDGSGYGTESILFALMGHAVTGVELVEERTELAQSRLSFFASCCDFPLQIEFINAHIFRFFEKSPPFDIIWAMEAVSHIFPQEDFFKFAWNKLKPGGKLIISDPNRLNPLAWLRAARIRGSFRHKPHQRFSDPETRTATDYGQEQILTLRTVHKKLEQAGFRLKRQDISGFMGSTFLPNTLLRQPLAAELLHLWQNICRSLPGIRRLGSIYTIVAEK